jgi:hypothetical protein
MKVPAGEPAAPGAAAPPRAIPVAAPVDVANPIDKAMDEEGIGRRKRTRALRPGEVPCPECGAPLSTSAVLCIDCGFNFEKGKRIAVKRSGSKPTTVGPLGAPASSIPAELLDDADTQLDGLDRQGPPWENIGLRWSARFFSTLGGVLAAPNQTFLSMRRHGGRSWPLTYSLASYVLTSAVALLAALVVIWFVPIPGEGDAGAATSLAASLGRAGLLGVFALSLGLAIVLVPLWMFVHGGMAHLALWAVGGKKQNFESSFRVVGYVMGTLLVLDLFLAIIPGIGPLLAWLLTTVYMTLGLTSAHRTSPAQGMIAAVLANALFAGGVYGSVWLLVNRLGPAVWEAVR